MMTLDVVIAWLEHIMAVAWAIIAVNSISGWFGDWRDFKQNIAWARAGETRFVSRLGSESRRPGITLVCGCIIVLDFIALLVLLVAKVVFA